MVPSANQRNDPKRGNRRNNRGQGYRRNDHPDNWRKSNPDNRTNISSRGNLIPSVPVEARAEPSFASMTEEEQLYYAIKMSLEGPAHERAMVGSKSEQRNFHKNQENSRRRDFSDNGNYGSSHFQEKRDAQQRAMAGSESEQRNFHQNQENSSRRDFTDNGNYRSSHFQEKRDAQRGQKNRERRNEWSQGSSAHGNEYYQEESRPCPSFQGGRQDGRNGIKHQNLSFHTDRRINNVNDDTGSESQKVEKGQFSSEKKYNINPNRQFGYRELDNMLQNFEPSIIIKLLNSEKKQFEMLLLKEMNFDWYYLIISLLAKLCKSDVPELHQSLFLDLLVMVKRSGFLAKLPSQIAVISTGKKIPNEKVVELHKSLVSFFQTFMDKSSTSACDSVPEKYFEGIVKMESLLSINRYEVPQDVYADLAVLQLRLDDARKNFVGKNDDNTGKQLRRMAYVEELSHRPPPNDFRELNVVPTFEDVNYEEEPFFRAALVDRPYKSIDDYLDVQFRLLREDFFSPLRSGIQEYRNLIKDRKKNRSKINNIRIYRDVKFVDYDIVSGSYIIAFSKKGLARVTWENSKRLMHGSLLCLSKDDFSSGIFATVAKRDTKALSEKGIIHVRIEETENSEGYTNGSFIMAESSVYFEAYRNVLYVLQNYTEKNFPLMEIVLGQVTVSHLPDYLSIAREQHVDTTYNLSALVQPTYYRQSANILELDEVMTPGDLNLDKNQFEAFKLALTEKVAIIHGPPGTGKTFIGLKVVQTLLANHHIWRINEVSQSVKSPILIVCYTNHALDQFLEGILRFTTDVVRIGGMSKSEAIKACNLSEIRKKCKGRLNTAIDRRFLYEKRQELRDLTSKLHEENCLIKLVGKKIVLHESELLDRDVIPPKLLGSFNQYGQKDERSGMARWLCVNEIPLLKSALEGLEKLSATSQEAQGPLDTEDKQEEEDEIDSLERTIAEPQNVGDSVDDFVSTVEGLKRTTTASGISFRFVWSEELANEDVRELEQILETKNISEAEYNSAVAELERHKESTRLILKILEVIPPVSQDSLQSVINSASRGFTLLPLHERWILYGRWRQDILDELMKKRDSLERRYQRLREQINDLSVEEDALYCATMDIVAATTSGCAKYNKLVRHLAPKIVVMEEAAEVLEAHTLVPLTSKCEHFILIGDHQQLRPSTSSYKLAKDFNLDVSMFERFIKLGMKHVTLSLQHRMRPEVARLIAPAIYQSLRNHSSVLKYPDVKGVKKNVFFLAHEVLEKADNEQKSHLNPHEAEISLNLARYLIQQGYSPSQITVLTTYSGQLLYMLQLRKRSFESLSGVKITVVDNYQGEENDIIILSLVRSNIDAKIGFLAIENRVCVALSRAKQGLYMIGNMGSLDSKSKLWKSIHKTLDENNEIGPQLELVCQIHGTETKIKCPNDFNTVIEGGCTEKCNAVLRCGHICPSMCHIQDRDHLVKRCTKPCERYVCIKKHRCPKKCFENCGNCMVKLDKELPCGHVVKLPCYVNELDYKCVVLVEKMLPDCGHIGRVHCAVDPKGHPCSIPCDFRLYCGHSCERKCHVNDDPEHKESICKKPCSKNNKGCKKNHRCRKICWEECNTCQITINHKLPCNHEIKIQCSTDVNDYKCKVKVKKLIAECQHTNEFDCSVTPQKSLCKAKTCRTILSCGHKCMKACKEICSSANCQELVRIPGILSCGHPEFNFCNKRNEKAPMEAVLELCQEPCKGQLSCDHQCTGKCGQCFQGRLHKQCEADCNRQLVCGHTCKEKCSDRCPPCKEACQSKCPHSKCKARCGDLCSTCEERCTWNCPHKKCSKKCGELCDRDPCDEPCNKSLKCGHPCIGLCGEECPTQCRICNRTEIVDEFFLLGTEGDKDSRFIFLPNCKHAIEVDGMDYWMNKASENEIGLRACPRCKTPITSISGRYGNVTRQVYRDVEKVKKLYYAEGNFVNEINNISVRISQLKVRKGCEGLSQLVDELERRVNGAITKANRMRKQKAPVIVTMTKDQLELTKIQTDIVEKLMKIWDSATQNPASGASSTEERQLEMKEALAKLLVKSISRLAGNCLSRRKLEQQDVDDFTHEIERLDLVKCYYFILSAPTCNFLATTQHGFSRALQDIETFFHGTKKLSTVDIHKVKQLLQYLLKTSNTRGIGIPESERKMIVQAMGLRQGHWYKCPNGHVYCITECGGAMVESKCNECGAKIGGESHRLRNDNDLAQEMDGASTSAWPDNRFN